MAGHTKCRQTTIRASRAHFSFPRLASKTVVTVVSSLVSPMRQVQNYEKLETQSIDSVSPPK
jgi:hypothetical protein